jgi:hypothetical protein
MALEYAAQIDEEWGNVTWDKEIPDMEWIVDGLIPAGMTILAGRPKSGKSYLALQLAFAVASGSSFLGKDAKQGKVLYIALEDSERRMQDRMKQVGNQEAAQNILFRYQLPYLNAIPGGIEVLKAEVEKHDFRLIIIDTLPRAYSGTDWQDQDEATNGLGPLQQWALTNNIGLILLGHHKKARVTSGNQLEGVVVDILGSTALAAVPDTLMGLYPDTGGRRYHKLLAVGRDVGFVDVSLIWDDETAWNVGIDIPKTDDADSVREVLGILREHADERMSVMDILPFTELSRATVHRALKTLIRDPTSGIYMADKKGSYNTTLYYCPIEEPV